MSANDMPVAHGRRSKEKLPMMGYQFSSVIISKCPGGAPEIGMAVVSGHRSTGKFSHYHHIHRDLLENIEKSYGGMVCGICREDL